MKQISQKKVLKVSKSIVNNAKIIIIIIFIITIIIIIIIIIIKWKSYLFTRKYYDIKQKYYDIKQVSLMFSTESIKVFRNGVR